VSPEIEDLLQNPEKFISRLTIMHKQKQRLSKFDLNTPQKILLETLRNHNRVIILKARQMGISTLTRGWHFWQAYMSDEPRQYAVISHTRDSSEELHRMEKTFYENLPDPLRRPLAKSSAKTLQFKDSGSAVRTYTAGGKGGTRSFAMNSVHLSEFAFYENQEEVMATVMAAVGDGQIIIESTPNVPGDKFHELVEGARKGENGWKLVFFPWFVHKHYTAAELPGWYIPTAREKVVQEEHQLSVEQLFWRRQQLKTLGSDKFVREYPATIEEAFRASGVQFFDPEALSEIKGLDMGSHEHRQYALPEPGEAYVMGVDVGSGLGKKTDFSAITVISASTRQPVYHFISNKTPPSKLADKIVDIWKRYNEPRVIVESNGNGMWVIHRLKELKVRNLYKDKNGKPFRTTVGTRPLMFQAIKAVVDGGVIHSLDKHVLDELTTIVYIKDKPQAAKKKNDDVTISMALCYYLLEKMPLLVSRSVKTAMMEKHIASMRAKKSKRAIPWNVRGGNKTGGY
jgi:hypothetical protein